ncbi:unnamed protein product (mitochondrion) [Plasmodiophora brassicae]|uniref:Peroxisomal leader peptide-processing protease n=2 Tax=Plasmodiophora brassicae TaxID=37360 RepID=A0A3P3Y083_PLABS|nr:unnamed protein product [Plasmodiophora brassicae]
MEAKATTTFASDPRTSCVLVRITGECPASLRTTLPFYSISRTGRTTISVSGIVIGANRSQIRILCNASALSLFNKNDIGIVAVLPGHPDPVDCRLDAVGRVSCVDDAFRAIMEQTIGWTVGWRYASSSNDAVNNLMSPAALAVVTADVSQPAGVRPVTLGRSGDHGQDVYAVSSPFGLFCPAVMQNGVSKGVVGNTIRPGCLQTIDARCLPGSEGGGVFCTDGNLVGVVTIPLRRADQTDTTAVNMMMSVEAIAGFLSRHRCLPPMTRPAAGRPRSNLTDRLTLATRSVVPICLDRSWASAVIIHSDGYLVTNAHLLIPSGATEPGPVPGLRVRLDGSNFLHGNKQGRRWAQASVVYCSSGPWDLALVHIDQDELVSVSEGIGWSFAPPRPGTSVAAVGHALFDPSVECTPAGPSVSRGTLAKVGRIRGGEPVLLQSSALVHRGNSGGMLLDVDAGRAIGVVSCNIRQSLPGGADRDSATIPSLNFSIPARIIADLITYIHARDDRILAELNKDDEAIRNLWLLKSPQARL